MNITLERIQKSYNPKVRPPSWVLDDINLSIESGERFFLLGPSGCGKTTLLRMLAGFHEPDSGVIRFGERRMNGVPPQNRNTAMVFQNYATWPHLTVFENVAYGPRARGLKGQPLNERVTQALNTVRMNEYAKRKPGELSGGQQQRVALARALAVQPDVLLFDEPLSNLDAKLRLELRSELQRIHREMPRSSVYVTHDQEEALSLADRIAVLNKGKIAQIGKPADLYEKPTSEFVARFMGEINFLSPESPLVGPFGPWASGVKQIGVRPERVTISESTGVSAQVETAVYLGSKVELTLTLPSGEKLKTWSATPPSSNQVFVSVSPDHLIAVTG